jgi:hypothetical protein
MKSIDRAWSMNSKEMFVRARLSRFTSARMASIPNLGVLPGPWGYWKLNSA